MPTSFLKSLERQSLTYIHDSLMEALLDMSFEEVRGDEPFLPVGSLTAFKKLRCIGTEDPILFNSSKTRLVSILPACLEMLVLMCCHSDIHDKLKRNLKVFNYYGKQKFPVLNHIGIDAGLGGAFCDIGPDGKHEREEELREYLDILARLPEAPNREQSIQSFTQELEGTQAGKPSEAEWVMWRGCKKCEEDLVAEFKELGIELQFNLSQGDCWVVMHGFMIY